MRVREFISTYCKHCDDFDDWHGCECYIDEECDEAHAEKKHNGMTMQKRICDYCEKLYLKDIAKKVPVFNVSKPPKFNAGGNRKESVSDIIMQIWNDGAEGITYEKSDIDGFRRRLKKASLRNARKGV